MRILITWWKDAGAADIIAGGRLQLGISRGSPEQVIDGWRYFGYSPNKGEDDAEMGRRHAEEFLELLRGKGFAKPNPRPMFPNPTGLLRLEPYSAGLRDRIWWGSASNATAGMGSEVRNEPAELNSQIRRDRRTAAHPTGRADSGLSRSLEGSWSQAHSAYFS